jgi:hypothetical protein
MAFQNGSNWLELPDNSYILLRLYIKTLDLLFISNANNTPTCRHSVDYTGPHRFPSTYLVYDSFSRDFYDMGDGPCKCKGILYLGFPPCYSNVVIRADQADQIEWPRRSAVESGYCGEFDDSKSV